MFLSIFTYDKKILWFNFGNVSWSLFILNSIRSKTSLPVIYQYRSGIDQKQLKGKGVRRSTGYRLTKVWNEGAPVGTCPRCYSRLGFNLAWSDNTSRNKVIFNINMFIFTDTPTHTPPLPKRKRKEKIWDERVVQLRPQQSFFLD